MTKVRLFQDSVVDSIHDVTYDLKNTW